MKYFYAYKTSDGTRHEATTNAPSREAVFAALRKKGIRPIKVVAADGTKSNGEFHGIRKRVLLLSTLAAAILAGAGAWFYAARSQRSLSVKPSSHAPARALPRQVILGDRARIDGAADSLFPLKAERFLARFAEPGRPFIAPEADWPDKADFETAFLRTIRVSSNDFSEHVDLKRMVVGIKREMQTYLRFGGSAKGYLQELVKRQNLEISFREKALKHLGELLAEEKQGPAYDYWVKANAWLQSMGIYPIPQPQGLKGYRADFDLDE